MKRIYLYVFLTIILFLPQVLFSDTWVIPDHDISHEETYGQTTLLIRSKYKRGMGVPDQSVTLYRGKNKIGAINYFGDQLFVSPDKKYFLTVSNSGLCSIAFLIFDHEGNIIRLSYQDTLLTKQIENEHPVIYNVRSVEVLPMRWARHRGS